ncbi:MAG: hypothetical protein GXP26_00180 [Planctomycetes bacterium]|nr:hypothetical protein [Planctomycetota bacterium]
MRPACATPCTLALWAFFALCSAALAQQADPPSTDGESTAKEAAADSDAAVENTNRPAQKEKPTKPWESANENATAGPDIYLLPDKNGKLRQVLGFRYEEFQRAWRQQDKSRLATPPLFTLVALEVSGTADQSLAKLQIKLEILPRIEDWVGVPLQLPNLIVQKWELENQSSEEFLDFDTKRRSYVIWLKGKPDKSRRLTIHGLVKLSQGPTSPGLEIRLPHAARSQFVLQVPEPKAQFESSPGIDLTTSETETGGTEVRLTGQTSPLRLQWGSPDERKLAFNAVVESVGQVAIHVDRYRVHYDATFKINSYGKPLDRLHVQLPTGAVLTKESLTNDYRIVDQDGFVEILLPEPRSEPWELHLTAEQQRDEDEATLDESLCTVSGFNVLKAFRQSGTVLLSIDDQLQAYFDLDQDIEQVTIDDTQQSSTAQPAVAQFEYARLPWTLDVHTVARKQRVSVEPKYELRITKNQAELHLNFDYQFAGAYTPSVRLKMHGWEITDDQVESGGVVNLDRIESKQQGLLVLPITNPKAERVPVSLIARRDIKLGHLELPLPEPLHAFVLPGQLTVESEPSLRVTRSTTGTRGISIASATNQLSKIANGSRSRTGSKDALELRTFLADAVIAIDVAQREREVSVKIQTKIDVDSQKISVLQQLQYEVKYQPITQLELQIPEQLWNNSSLQVRLDGEEVPIGLGIFSEELPADPTDSSATTEGTPAPVKIRQLIVSLPRPMQSEFLLEIDYEEACPELATEALTPTALPLVAPKNNVISSITSVRTEKSIRATLNQVADRGPWSAASGAQSLGTAALLLKGTGKPTMVPLFMQIESEDDAERATLEFAWLQTWIVDKLQQDRAVFRFRTDQRTVFAQLPSELLLPAIEVLLDGIPPEFKLSPTNRLTVSIPNDQVFLSHTLEIRYQRNVNLSSWGALESKMPRLDSRPTSAPVFWQLVLPRGWHVASSPEHLSAEFWLGWQDYQWGRHPTYYQPGLERLTGATSAPPPASSNQYLYRGFEIPRAVRVIVVGQSWLVFTTTLAAFAIGLLLIYTPLMQNSLFWLVLTVALAGLVLVAPAFTMLAVQAIFWAGLMTVAAAILRHLFVGKSGSYNTLEPKLGTASTAVTAAWEPVAESEATAKGSQATPIQTGGSAS